MTSSFSSSILSAGSMFSWNCLKRLVWPSLSVAADEARDPRRRSCCFGAVATVLALKVQSVQALWFFTSDLVFVLLFPQLLCALFDPKANRTGSIAAFVVSPFLRVGGGRAAARPAGVPRVSRDACRSGRSPRWPVWCCCRWCLARPRAGMHRVRFAHPARATPRRRDAAALRVARASLHRARAGLRRGHGRADRARRRRARFGWRSC